MSKWFRRQGPALVVAVVALVAALGGTVYAAGKINGHAVKVWLASTSVTWMRGSMRLSVRAQVAPAKPPPTTTTRWVLLSATAGAARLTAAALAAVCLRKSRRLRLV